MNLVNRQYIKLDKFSIFGGLLNASDTSDLKKETFFQAMLATITKYEKEKRTILEDVYISIEDLCNPEMFDLMELPISRQTILNASLIALSNNDLEIAQKLSIFFPEYEVLPNELGELLDYVLEHSMDIADYFNGEDKEIVYNERENKLEERYIYSKPQEHKKRELKQKNV